MSKNENLFIPEYSKISSNKKILIIMSICLLLVPFINAGTFFFEINASNTSNMERSTNGTYDILLEAGNANGWGDREYKYGYIIVGEQTPDFVSNVTSGKTPLNIDFTDLSTNSPTSWNWYYENETSGVTSFSTSQNSTYTFVRGTYNISLKSTGSIILWNNKSFYIKSGYAPTSHFNLTVVL